MALKKTLTLSSGVAADYWKIATIHASAGTGEVHARLDGYVNQAARDAGKTPAGTEHLTCKLADVEAEIDTLRGRVYESAKLDPRFNGAEDV
jgi:hypothetical protein